MLDSAIYDRLFTQRIDSNIKALINNALGNHFPSLDALWLIQRWHPHNVAWAENLTDVFFEFLKPLSRTHLLTNGEINGSAYGFEPEYTADLPDELNLPAFPDEVTFKVPKGKSASISWIERSHDVVKAPYCERLTNEITCWHRSQRVVTAKDKDLEIKLDSRLWLINSCVIQGDGELLNLAPEQAGLILYQYADQTLEEIYDQLNISECKILTEFNISDPYGISIDSSDISIIAELQLDQSLVLTDWVTFDTPTFSPIPDYYYFVAFFKENEALGKPLSILAEENLGIENPDGDKGKFYFAVWHMGNYPDTGINLLIDREEARTKAVEAFGDWDVVINNCLSSSHFFNCIDNRLRYFEAPLKFEALDQTVEVSFDPPLTNGGSWVWEIEDTRGHKGKVVPGGWTSQNGWSTLTLKSGDLEYFNYYITSLPKRLKFYQYYWYNRYQYSPWVDYIAWGAQHPFAVHSFYPPQLIESSENIVFIHLGKGYRGRPGEPQRVNYLPIDLKVKINNNLTNNGIELSYVTEQNYPIPTTYYETGKHDRFFRFKVNFWQDAPLDYSPISRETWSLLDEEPDYSEGADNERSLPIKAGRKNIDLDFSLPFFDPDTDNGDIMPDSKRLIEIHAALQADKYSVDDTDPNLARVANLGWLIEKIGHVLGLHFKSDGAMLKIPDTKWVKLGDTIPEEYQLQQWGKNEWKNSDDETAKGVGMAYEVNSNYFGKDKFGKATIEEGGYVLVHSLPQLIEIIGDDLDRALGWQDLGANVLPKADGTGYITYQGLHSLLMEVAYMLSAMSVNTSHAHTLSLKNNAILQELLGALGLPVEEKNIPIKIMGQDAKIPYPGVSKEGASLVDFLIWILSNQALTTASHLSVKEQD